MGDGIENLSFTEYWDQAWDIYFWTGNIDCDNIIMDLDVDGEIWEDWIIVEVWITELDVLIGKGMGIKFLRFVYIFESFRRVNDVNVIV